MIYLLLSILTSSCILVIFKLFRKYDVDIFQAIVVNYVVAFSVGFLLFGTQWSWEYVNEGSWPGFALVIGILFISLFLLMGKSAQENGIGTTSVAVKMSLAIPVVAAIYIYNEAVTIWKIVGVVFALAGVFMITWQQKHEESAARSSGNMLFLIILFIGSGVLDTLINYVEKRALGDLSLALFTSIGFGVAGILGLTVLLIKRLTGKVQLSSKNVLGGIVLGIPNYFSIFFLLLAIRSPMEDSITYALNNMGIVMLSFLLGILFFQERLSLLKLSGAVVAIIAVVLLLM
jgi:drug/metabolite transporter (DMT)-like permease